MIVDGKKIADAIRAELKKEIQALDRAPRLDIVLIGSDPASAAYVKRKQAFGESIGADVVVHARAEDEIPDAPALGVFIDDVVKNPASDGVVIQLPLPESLRAHTRSALDRVPAEKDVDMLSSEAIRRFESGTAVILPTMAAVLDEIFRRYGVELHGKKIALVGATGELVGKPIARWLAVRGIPFSAINTKTPLDAMRAILKDADVIISGVGKVGFITPGVIKRGVIAIDAGTSSASGSLRGDMDPTIAEKAALFTPVPGGVGPITVAMLFRNLVTLTRQNLRSKI